MSPKKLSVVGRFHIYNCQFSLGHTVLDRCIFYQYFRCEGSPIVCKTDEVGEIVVNSPATGSSYWGLPGLTQSAFKVKLLSNYCKL